MEYKHYNCDGCEEPLDIAETHHTSRSIVLGELGLFGDSYSMVVAIAVIPRPPVSAGTLMINGKGAKSQPPARSLMFCRACICKYTVLALNQFETPRIPVQLASPEA